MTVPAPPEITEIAFELPAVGQDDDQFDANQANFVNYQQDFGPEVNDLAVWMEDTANSTEGWANDAEESATASEASRQAADAAANYKGEWSTLSGALNKPATVGNDGAFWALNNNLANVALSEPAPGNADWSFVSGTRWVTPYTASATLAANSQNTIIATSVPADMSLPTLATNDFIVLQNSPASTQTVRMMNSAYTIRGDAGSISPGNNIILLPGEVIHLKAFSGSILEVV